MKGAAKGAMRGARSAVRLGAIVLLAAATACGSEGKTGMIVEVAATPEAFARIDTVRLQVWNGDPSRPAVEETFPVWDGPVQKLPVRLGLRPADPGEMTTVRIEAAGWRSPDQQRLVTAGTTVTFRPGEVVRVLLTLGASCPSGCGPEQTCSPAGLCVPIGGGGDGGRPPEAGANAPTGTTVADASVPADAPSRTTPLPPMDSGRRDAGAPAPMPAPAPYPPAPTPTPAAPTPTPPPPPAPTPTPTPPPLAALGQRCQNNAACSSGFCVEGVCCDSSCSGTCRSCLRASTSGADGTCAPVTAGRDPDSECSAEDPATCGNAGGCDGGGSCRRHPAGTPCASAACQGNRFTPAATCNGQGTCTAPAALSCGRSRCGGQGCLTTCTSNDECEDDSFCSQERCVERKRTGPCASDRECVVGLACLLGLCV